MKNYRNICRTLASRHQLLQSYQLHGHFLDGGFSTIGAKQVDVSTLKSCVLQLAGERSVWEVKSAALGSTTYHTSDILIMKKGESPEFSQIVALYVISGKLFLLLGDLYVDGFRKRRYSYRVSKTDNFRVSEPGQEASHQRLDLYFGCEVMPRCEIALHE